MPYITASIIIQLLRVVIPRFQELHDEGAQGQAKLTQYTRYLTIALALLNATTIVSMARSGVLLGNCPGIIPQDDVLHILVIIITLCAGTGVIIRMPCGPCRDACGGLRGAVCTPRSCAIR